MIDAGFASNEQITVNGCAVTPREVAARVMDKFIPSKVDDVEYVRVEMTGMKNKKKKTLTLDCVTKSNKKHMFSAGAYDTGVPISIMGSMVANGDVKEIGVKAPELCIDPKAFFAALKRRGIMITARGG